VYQLHRVPVFLLTLCLFAASAEATSFSPDIDFRDDAIWPDVDRETHFTGTQADITLTLWATPSPAKLWQDDRDGIGIRRSYEDDEIEAEEILKVRFQEKVFLSAIYVADLFFERGYSETGHYRIDDGAWVEIDALSLPGTGRNGEHVIAFDSPVPLVDRIEFRALGRVGKQNHEYALMGFDATPVPEPSTAALLGLGLVALAARPRRR
jgi:hypothetical protein